MRRAVLGLSHIVRCAVVGSAQSVLVAAPSPFDRHGNKEEPWDQSSLDQSRIVNQLAEEKSQWGPG